LDLVIKEKRKKKKENMKTAQTSHNNMVNVRRQRAARLRKNTVGLSPFVCFFSATFGAGVVATQRPITRPKRHLPSARYVPFFQKFSGKGLHKINGYGIIIGMKTGKAFMIIGKKLEKEYKKLGFKYSKGNNWLKKSTKRFDYYVFLSSFSESIPDKYIELYVVLFINDKILLNNNRNINNIIILIDLWKMGNHYNIANETLSNDVYMDLKNKIEIYLLPFIKKLEEEIMEYKDEWIQYGFLKENKMLGFCTNLFFIDNVYGHDNAKKCLRHYMETLDQKYRDLFIETYKKYMNNETQIENSLDFREGINNRLFMDAVELKLLE
jgi:hypothetical protein